MPGWLIHPALQQNCKSSKFWYQIWNDCDWPKSGVVNDIRLYIKRRFAKCLTNDKAGIIDSRNERLETNPYEI